MILVVGLGNPGEKYEQTRHNLGFMVLEALLRDLTPVEQTQWKMNKKLKSLIAKVDDLVLAKPQTFVNVSGFAVQKLITNYKLLITNLWVVHDDLDLPLGKLKIRLGGAAGGHHGVESIIKQLGTDQFVRFRLGIGHPKKSLKSVEDYVLSPFASQERSTVKKMVKRTVGAVKVAHQKGLERAMNRFNQ